MFRFLLRLIFGGKKKKEKKKHQWAVPVLAVLVLIGLLDGGKHAVHAITTSTSPAPSHGSSRTYLSCSQLENLWVAAGGSSSAAFLAAEVAKAESSGAWWSTDDDGNGTVDYGLWQINTVNGGNPGDYNDMTNARAAVAISRDGTRWTPWVTYNKGAEVGQC